MQSNPNDKRGKWLCGILFLAFALSWLCLFQVDLLDELYHSLLHKFGVDGIEGFEESNFHYYAIPVALAVIITLLEIPVARLFRFKNGLYACNFLLSALLLGTVTGFDDYNCCSIVSGPDTAIWIATAIFCVVLFIVCKIIQTVPPRQSLHNGPRIFSSNLFIMNLLFCMVGFLGNTDENLHRALMINRYTADGQFEKALRVGENEEEANYAVSNARLNAMLRLDAANPGTGIGEYLFNFPVDNMDSMLDYLQLASTGAEHDSLSAVIAMAMINRDLEKADSLIMPYVYQGIVPKFYMQLLVLTENKEAADRLPNEYAAQKKILDNLRESLENIKDESMQFQANSTYLKYHKTYFWYYFFNNSNI